MEIDLVFKIAAVGIIVAVLHQLLLRTVREDQSLMVTIAGIIAVMMMLIGEISDFFETVKSVFGL